MKYSRDIISGYDLANEIIAKYPSSSVIYNLAADFLQFSNDIAEITGDDDSPFNPRVDTYIKAEEKFIQDINLNLPTSDE